MQMRFAESGGSVYVITTFVFRTDRLRRQDGTHTLGARRIAKLLQSKDRLPFGLSDPFGYSPPM
jgi:hypothetical protein